MAFVPTNLAEITPDWLTATLSERLPGTEVTSAEAAPLHDIANYNGTLAKVLPVYASNDGAAPDSLVAKLVPDNERMLHLGTSLGVYRREAALYSSIGPATGVRMPNLLGYSEDPGSGISALLL
ncbi:MAG: hypothetical protein E2O36_05530, partial [Proteobacteria bacterium]